MIPFENRSYLFDYCYKDICFYEGDHYCKCYKCKQHGIVIACDFCPLVFHPYCLYPELKEQPQTFVCPVCCDDFDSGNIDSIKRRCELYSRREKIEDWINTLPSSNANDLSQELNTIKKKQKPKSTNQFCSSNYRGVYVSQFSK